MVSHFFLYHSSGNFREKVCMLTRYILLIDGTVQYFFTIAEISTQKRTNCCLMFLLQKIPKSMKENRYQWKITHLAFKKIHRKGKSSFSKFLALLIAKWDFNRKTTLHLYMEFTSVIKARNEKEPLRRLVFKIKTGTLSASKVLASDKIVLPYGDTLTRFKQREKSTAIK